MADKGTQGGFGQAGKTSRRGPVALSELVSKAIAPLTSRRGLSIGDLIAAWPGIVGSRFADCTRPEKISWPKGEADEWRSGVLIVRVDGPRAVFFQHEVGQVVERVNAFLGYAAIGRIRIMQGPVAHAATKPERGIPHLPAGEEARLSQTIAGVEDEGLREVLGKLGRGVLSEKKR
jgi:hypothetical protein